MRRLLRFILFSGYLVGPWAVAHAQTEVVIDVARVVATTNCVKDRDSTYAVSVINMDMLDSPNLQEVKVHEAAHMRQFAADSTLCPELMRLTALKAADSPELPKALGAWVPKLLKLEVGAYCESAQVPIANGADPETVYLDDLNMLIGQFFGWLPREVVISAWFTTCGKLIGGPDGEGK